MLSVVGRRGNEDDIPRSSPTAKQSENFHDCRRFGNVDIDEKRGEQSFRVGGTIVTFVSHCVATT